VRLGLSCSGLTSVGRRPYAQAMSADQAIELIHQDATIAVGSLSAEPIALTSALVGAPQRRSLQCIVAGLLLSQSPLLQSGDMRLRTWFAPSNSKAAIEYLPMSWYQGRSFLSSIHLDAALITVSPPDRKGNHSLGVSVGLTRAIAKQARVVIAEVNPNMPFTGGESLIHRSHLDAIV